MGGKDRFNGLDSFWGKWLVKHQSNPAEISRHWEKIPMPTYRPWPSDIINKGREGAPLDGQPGWEISR